MLLKMLVGAACVVVIAAGGYYLWGEYSAPNAESVMAARSACAAALRNINVVAACIRDGYLQPDAIKP